MAKLVAILEERSEYDTRSAGRCLRTEGKRIAKLEALQRRLHDCLDDENVDRTDEQAPSRTKRDGRGNELKGIERTLVVYLPRPMATGAAVSHDHMGRAIAHRGLLHEEPA